MKYYSLFVVFLLLFGCSPKSNSFVVEFQPTLFKLESIKALNLSEDMSTMSSLQDEIFCKICFVAKTDSTFEITNEFQLSTMRFNAKNTVQSIEKSLNLKNSKVQYIVCSLVELDTEGNNKQLDKTITQSIEKGIFLTLNSPLQIDTLIGDDDFLGMKYIDLSKPQKAGKQRIKISGRQLFDKFDYRIYYHFE